MGSQDTPGLKGLRGLHPHQAVSVNDPAAGHRAIGYFLADSIADRQNRDNAFRPVIQCRLQRVQQAVRQARARRIMNSNIFAFFVCPIQLYKAVQGRISAAFPASYDGYPMCVSSKRIFNRRGQIICHIRRQNQNNFPAFWPG